MTEQEKINSEVQMKLAMQDAKFAIFMEELKQQREDIRRLNERQDADRKELNAKIDALGNQINATWRQTMIGIGGIIVTVSGIIFAVMSFFK